MFSGIIEHVLRILYLLVNLDSNSTHRFQESKSTLFIWPEIISQNFSVQVPSKEHYESEKMYIYIKLRTCCKCLLWFGRKWISLSYNSVASMSDRLMMQWLQLSVFAHCPLVDFFWTVTILWAGKVSIIFLVSDWSNITDDTVHFSALFIRM